MRKILIFLANSKIENAGNIKYSLDYIPVTEETDKSSVYITDIQGYKNQLYTYPVKHTTL